MHANLQQQQAAAQQRPRCAGAPARRACGSGPRRLQSRAPLAAQAVLATSPTARLPASHLQSSIQALEQLKASTVNSELGRPGPRSGPQLAPRGA